VPEGFCVLLPFEPLPWASQQSEGRAGLVFAPEHMRAVACADFMHAAGAAYARYADDIDATAAAAGGGLGGMETLLDMALHTVLSAAAEARCAAAAVAESEKEAREAEIAKLDAENAQAGALGLLEGYHEKLRSEGVVEDSAEWNAKEEAFCLENDIAVPEEALAAGA
jgi:hypothetical protein